ncbi:hypothetical protein CO2235_200127 [Cupriavidus oxalaticus]|uniref:Uncharacterized protein n=1 Tax=Cupriavidus oxalaticus TaxID=96344 RepID=A0A375FVF0_9BURK|nr:hypothetical protein CO2235_U850042 [Cupriavidus oxalaticus]SPC14271.1 hypothetical protein CO2235_200127 [Cupriavidus oxalaticus]
MPEVRGSPPSIFSVMGMGEAFHLEDGELIHSSLSVVY